MSPGLQGLVDVPQNLRRMSEVVDHVERRDELVAIPLFKPRRILDLEANVIESLQLRIPPGSGDACSHQLTASLVTPSHHSALPSPNNTSAVSSGRSVAPDEFVVTSGSRRPSTASNTERAFSQAPLAKASCPLRRSAVDWGMPSVSIAGPNRLYDTE